MIDIFITCFTAMRSRDVSDATRQYCKVTDDKEDQKVQVSIKFESEWEVNIKLITVEYVRTNFILDFLACVPGILRGQTASGPAGKCSGRLLLSRYSHRYAAIRSGGGRGRASVLLPRRCPRNHGEGSVGGSAALRALLPWLLC